MLHRSLSILLASTIAICPLVCKWSAYGVRAGNTMRAGDGCCCCHSDTAPMSSSDRQAPAGQPPHRTGKCCQCICGGAMTVHQIQLPDFASAVSWLGPNPIADTSVVFNPNERHAYLTSAPPPGADMNLGRALRCLLASFLC